MTKQRCGKEVRLKYSSLVHPGNIALCANVSEARRKDMTKPALHEEQFCSRCNAWGPADLMQPLYRFPDKMQRPGSGCTITARRPARRPSSRLQ